MNQMGFFTVGNLLTLGIVLLILFLYRQMDRSNRNLKLLRDYSEKLKKELASYMEEQEKAVKDYGILLNVEREAAKELLKRLQLTEEELADKAAAVARLDGQIKGYENSLSELDRMTSRVQENMNRVRDESAFVESTGKRISETKAVLSEMEETLKGLESRFERENTESLEKAMEASIAGIKSDLSDISVMTEDAERRVEDYRGEINTLAENFRLEAEKAEEARSASMARDVEQINAMLKNAVEEAGKRADKMEESALLSLKEQAEDRIQKLKTAEEEKLKNYQESARARVADVQNMVKSIREEWITERNEWEAKEKAIKDERRKDIQELNVQAAETEKRVNADIEIQEKQIEELSSRMNEAASSHEQMLRRVLSESQTRFTGELDAVGKRVEDLKERGEEIVSSQEDLLVKSAAAMKQKALEITGAELDEYRHAQEAEFRRLDSLIDDSRNLDAELRRSMQEVTERIKDDFARYERESAEIRKMETEKFSAAAEAIKGEMAEAGRELALLKSTARDNVSEKLKLFEDEFLLDLSRRGSDIDQRLSKWQENLESRLSDMGTEAETARRELEAGLAEEMRKTLSIQDTRLVSELDHLKAEAGALEEGIRERMNAADDSVTTFREELELHLEEARKEADLSIKSEIGKHSIAAAEALKQHQRELEAKLREMSENLRARNAEMEEIAGESRTELDKARENFQGKIRDLDESIEEARRRVRDLSSETDNRIAQVRSSVDETERHIKEAVDQAKLLDRAEELKTEMQRRIEDLKGDIDRLDQRRVEIAQLENDFVKIRRLEDDVNAKMTRFLSEKHRIETMEADFNRLLQTSRAVEEKLSSVTDSDDVLQSVQLQIRRLEEALRAAEEKYQRMEKKSQILDNTNDGIDRNFRQLQESERLSAKMSGDLDRYAEDLSVIKVSIEKLAGESVKAGEAVSRLDVLDNALEEIEERIKSMQRARTWIADAETRLEELNKDILMQAKAAGSLVKGKKSGRDVDLGEGAPSMQKKENVIALKKKGWPNDVIAKTLKIGIGEVELILEMAPKDN